MKEERERQGSPQNEERGREEGSRQTEERKIERGGSPQNEEIEREREGHHRMKKETGGVTTE